MLQIVGITHDIITRLVALQTASVTMDRMKPLEDQAANLKRYYTSIVEKNKDKENRILQLLAV